MNIGYEQKRLGASWIRRKKNFEENGNWSSGFPFLVPFFPEALNMKREKSGRNRREVARHTSQNARKGGSCRGRKEKPPIAF